jgi:hypothetical protein
MSWQQPGPGWWRASDGVWYPPPQHPVAGAPSPTAGGDRQPTHGGKKEKEPRSRTFREWIQTTQGVLSLIVSIVALAGGTAVIIKIGPSPTPKPPRHRTQTVVRSPSIPSPSPSTVISTGPVSSEVLQSALLPADTLGSAAFVAESGTDLSQLGLLCGGPPQGATATAYETLRDSQTSQFVIEAITEWQNSTAAGQAIMTNRQAVDASGSCSVTYSGITEQFVGDDSGSPPSSCTAPAQYFATQSSVPSDFYFGFDVEVQCGDFTIVVNAQGDPSIGTQSVVNGYISSAVGQFESAIG